ncbi:MULTISPECIES: MFS transporter [unclassified Sporolactobacillus]|uniref:MFS transporter n=1 Tax=unclassified Sporolactobacillus TaxID=2628533 RepID=UPI002367C7FB|nr:MFS transporter [Sporolactobacillus sp. CQH2019]MDD9146962.1 MFS transporter [Sporolactobacillus sp. CQH2019]
MHYAWKILISCLGFYALVIGVLCNTAGIFLTPVMNELGWSRTDASMYLTIFPLVAAVMQPVVGKMLQKYSPRMLLTVSVVVFGLAYIATGWAQAVWQWNVFGVIYGITAAFYMYIPTPWLINNWFSKKAGFALGIASAALSLFAAFASPIGQAMITSVGWRETRIILGIVVLIIAVPLTWFFVRKSPSEMGLKPYGYEENSTASDQAAASSESSGLSVKKAVKTPAFYLLILLAGIYCLNASFFQQIPSFAAIGKLGAAAGAMAVSIIMVGGIIGKFILGWLNDALGTRVMSLFSAICGAIGMALAYFAGSNVLMFYVGMVIFGFGYSGLSLVCPMITKGTFGPKDYSQIYSYVTTGIFLFSAAAPLLYARIFDATKSFNISFYIVIIGYIVAAFLAPIIMGMGKRLQRNS